MGKFLCPAFSPASLADGEGQEGNGSSVEESLPVECVWNHPEHHSGSYPGMAMCGCLCAWNIHSTK